MGFNVDKFNRMVNQASNIISCDSDCKREKRQELLKKRFETAQYNLHSAPEQLSLATKQYFAFSNGELKYSEITRQELVKKAKLLAAEIAMNFLEHEEKARDNLKIYLSNLTDAKVANEYNLKLKEEIKKLQNILYVTINAATTNDRKSYYEEEGTSYLRSWNSLLKIVFYIFVVALIVSFVAVPNSISMPAKVIITVLLALYPFYILYIAVIFMKLYSDISNVFPSNIYNNI